MVVPSLEAFSSDILIQEVVLDDLRARHVRVISTTDADVEVLADARPDAARMLVRDVLVRRAEYERSMRAPSPIPERVAAKDDVVIELVPAQTA